MSRLIILAKCKFCQMRFLANIHDLWKIKFRRNVTSAECSFSQVRILENKFSGKCNFWRCKFWKISFREKFRPNVIYDNCKFWKINFPGNVTSGKFLILPTRFQENSWQVHVRANVHRINVISAKCFLKKFCFWRVFFGKVYRIQ